jgi:hypothetical protein
MSTLNLRQRRVAAMIEVGYVKRGAAQQGTGVQRDVVVSEVRAILLKHGIDISTSQVGPGRYIENASKSSSGTPLCIYVAMYATTFVNIDDPSDQLTIQHEGQGNDHGDKAPGKAATYAEKLNLVKGLMLETGIADEGRNPGDGDASTEDAAQSPSKDAIRAPKAKAAPTADDTTPASKGLIKMLRAETEAKGLVAMVTKKLEKAGHSWDAMPKSVAAKAHAWVEAAKPVPHERQPGEEG